MVATMLSPPILLMVSKVYVPVLFPLTFAFVLVSAWLDGAFGLGEFLPTPWNWAVAAVSMAAGLVVVAWSYTDLVVDGDGSPSPTAGRTRRLVVRGPYAHCRNPSVHGKLLGVLSVGFALNSAAFCFVLIPLVLGVSLIEKVVRQEPQLVAAFGDDYLAYRANVPLFLPRLTPWVPPSRRAASP